ncbi:hypothetical protein AX15_003280 [Amanita polypyramis BW_CC]|nr:hypothetical protein AX15_003280 [Amanita polypyramis BW_CC]
MKAKQKLVGRRSPELGRSHSPGATSARSSHINVSTGSCASTRTRVILPKLKPTQHGRTSANDSMPYMELHDSISGADADGEEVSDDDEDVIVVNDMLMNADSSSRTPTTILEHTSPSPSPLSPLFTPPYSAERAIGFDHVKYTPTRHKQQSPMSPSKIVIDLLTPPPPDTIPSTSTPGVEDIFAFPMETTGSRTRQAELAAKPKGQRGKRIMLSHIAVPPLPDSVSRKSYRSMSSIPLKTSSKLLSRHAKAVAQIKVHKTLGLGIAIKSNMELETADNWKDPTYEPPTSKKKKNAIPGSAKAPGVGSMSGSNVATPLLNSASAFVPLSTKPSSTATKNTVERNSAVAQGSPLPAPTPLSSHASPLTPVPLSRISEDDKKRKYKRHLDEDYDGDGSDSLKAKKFKVVKENEREHDNAEINVHPPKEQTKQKRRGAMSTLFRYYDEQDILRIFIQGIPPTHRTVLAMNTRHVRREKSIDREDEDWSQFIDMLSTTKEDHDPSASWFVWPPPNFEMGEEEEYYLGGMLEELVDYDEKPGLSSKNGSRCKQFSTSNTIVGDELFGAQEEAFFSLSPSPRSPTVVPREEERITDEYTDKPPAQPSAKALGKRKAASSPPSRFIRAMPHFPQWSAYDQEDIDRSDSDAEGILHMEQYLEDFGPSPSHILNQTQSVTGSVDKIPNVSIANTHLSTRQYNGGYDADTLSRALISVDNDPFISSGLSINDVDPFLDSNPLNTTSTTWPDSGSFSGDVYDDVFNGKVSASETIDPVLLRGTEFAGSNDLVVPSIYQLQDHLIHAPSRPTSPLTAHDSSRMLADIFPPTDPTFHSPLLSVNGRRQVKTRRPPDMIDIMELDLDSSRDPSDVDIDSGGVDCDDPAYVPPVSTVKAATGGELGQRRGPRIVSAKELARIQKRKALEREKEKEEEKERALVATAATSAATVRHPRSKYACGTEHTFCHQCRRRTYYLKMECSCGKFYCNRCISLRYDNLPFDEHKRDWVCPACQDFCTCDAHTRQRGEVYVSLRPARYRDSGEQITTRSKREKSKKARRSVWSSSDRDEDENDELDAKDEVSKRDFVQRAPAGSKQHSITRGQETTIRVEKPFPPTPIVGTPGSYWAAVYALTGERVGMGFVGEGNRNVRTSCSLTTLMFASGMVPRKKRVFVGRLQPCWGKEMKTSKIRVLEDEADRAVGRLTRTEGVKDGQRLSVKKRVYIGKPEVFLKRVVMPRRRAKEDGNFTSGAASDDVPSERTKFAYSLSPLSILSSLPSDSGAGGDKHGASRPGHVGNAVLPEGQPTTGTGLLLGLRLELKPSDVTVGKVTGMVESRKPKACQDNRDISSNGNLDQDGGVGGGGNDDCNGNGNGSGFGKYDGVPPAKNNAVKDGQEREREVETLAEANGEERIEKDGDRMRSASFSADTLDDSDVARAILLSLSVCGMPVNA